MLNLVDEETANAIIDLQEDIKEYSYFKQAMDLGICFTPRDLSFSKMVLYSSIREASSGK